MNKIYVIFDHHCPFCSFWANKLLSWDTENKLYIVSSTSLFALTWANERGVTRELFERTVVVYEPNHGWFIEAEAIRYLLNTLTESPVLLKTIIYLSPSWLVNVSYRVVSKFRKRSGAPCTLEYLSTPEKAERIIL